MNIGLLAVAFVCASVGVVEAQQPRRRARQEAAAVTPHAGSMALGANFGIAAPNDDLLDNGLTPNGNFEYYVTPRFSLRALGGTAWSQFDAPRLGKNVRPTYIDFSSVYNWEGGAWHPFVAGGVGLYHYHVSEPPFSGGNTEPGVSVGGGLEYFLDARNSLKGEVTYHGVAGQATGPFATTDTSFWTTTFGFKRYF